MRKAKKVSLAAILSALSVVVMSLGAFIQLVDLTAVALASVMVIFARIELGPPYEWLVYGVSGTLSLILMIGVNPVIPAFYLAFAGMYPILKAYFERRTRKVAWLCKSVYFFVMSAVLLAAAYLLSVYVLGIPFFEGALAAYAVPLLIALYVVAVLACYLYDLLLSSLIVLYMARLRPKIAATLK